MCRISARVLEIPNEGFLNLHGGDLPRYRGNATANWAILEGENKIGITVHKMVPELDAGPILRQETVPITEETTVSDLVKSTREIGTRILLEILDDHRRGLPLEGVPQDPDEALRCFPRIPEYGRIDWTESANQIDRHVRSLGAPYPNAFTYFHNLRVEVLSTDVLDRATDYLAKPGHIIRTHEDGDVWVATGYGIIVLERIQFKDGPPIPPGQRFGSIRERFGMNVTREIRELTDRIEKLERNLANQESTNM
jgi:methionyl-tRNA formyltransferase